MYRKCISDGDLLILDRPWWGLGKWIPYRNLSAEVREMEEITNDLRSKYMESCNRLTIASKNVGDDLETLQALLLDNSDAYFETSVDNSILEKREGVKYSYKRGGNEKQGASSNQGQQKQKQKQPQKKTLSLMELLSGAKFTVH